MTPPLERINSSLTDIDECMCMCVCYNLREYKKGKNNSLSQPIGLILVDFNIGLPSLSVTKGKELVKLD